MDPKQLTPVTAELSSAGSVIVANHFVAAVSLSTLVDRLSPAGWSVQAGPTFEELYRQYIGPKVPPGSDAFALVRARK